MVSLPTGTVTFLYTDIEGSTKRWEAHPGAMKTAVERHDVILRTAIEGHGGVVFRTEGDAFRAAFPLANQALAAALDAQYDLHGEVWDPEIAPINVRMAMHTGVGEVRDGDYVGPHLNRVARLLATAYGGQILLSQATSELVRDGLSLRVSLLDLGAHRLKDLQRPEQVFQVVVPDLPSNFPPLKSLDNRPNNLPVQRSPLVGREQELAEVQSLLQREDVGLLTLSGPGGIGKSRLSLQVAAEMVDRFRDGAYFVALAPIATADLVVPTIAQALGVKEMPGHALKSTLASYLSDREVLLVLDNFEHVVAAAPEVADLLAAAPELKVLVTSREVLRLMGEQEYHVPPLGLPDLDHLPSTEEIAEYDAVAMFLQRARLVQPDFKLDADNAPAIAEICYRLDGLPLAIELAAARIRLLSPQAMRARLASRLKLLTGGARDLPERQQTLRSAIQWSYDLLHPAEQVLFRRLAVFSGGCTLEASAEVCDEAGDLDIDVLDGVSSLVDKSLLRQRTAADAEPRFWMLETIREYGREKLDESQDRTALLKAHAYYFARLADAAEKQLEGAQQEIWFKRIDLEYDNLRAALTWALEQSAVEMGLRLCTALWHYWQTRGLYTEGRRWSESMLALPGAEDQGSIYAGTLFTVASLSWHMEDFTASESFARRSIAVLETFGPTGERSRARSQMFLANALSSQGKPAEGRAYVEEAVATFRRLHDNVGLSNALLTTGIVANNQGDQEAARKAFEESILICRAQGDIWGLSQALNGLGDVMRICANYDRAGELYEESLNLYRQLGARADVPAALHNLGHVALGKRDPAKAEDLFTEALHLQVTLENKPGICECVSGLAGVAAAQRRGERAARLFGAIESFRREIGTYVWPAERTDYQRNLAAARALLDESAWQRAWHQGGAMSRQAAIDYALNVNAD